MPISSISFVRATVLSILVGLGALLAIVAVNLWLVHQANVYSDLVDAGRAQRSALADLSNALEDAETGQRGYLLTGQQQYLDPYNAAIKIIPGQVDGLLRFTPEHTHRRDMVVALQATVRAKLAELQKTISLYETGQREEALALVKTDQGQKLMAQARQSIAQLTVDADNRLASAVSEQRDSMTSLQWVTIGGAVVIFLVVGGSVWTVLAYTRQLLAARQEVTDLNVTLEQRVRERTADLGRANEEIQRFAYIVTHDLRAPLVNIMGFTSELEGCLASIQKYLGKVDGGAEDSDVEAARSAALEDLPEAIGFIRSSTRKMDGLINAILKLSREGRRVLKPEPIKLDTLLKTAAENVQHRVNEAGGEVEIDSRIAAVVSDRLALEQIFGNLLDNAVKYRAAERPIKIKIRAFETSGRRVHVEVQDNGRGIAKQDHERVFDLFRRSGAQDQPGEGIGLAHVRTMVRNLGGDITLQSEPEQGTTMKLNLPRDLRTYLAAQQGAA